MRQKILIAALAFVLGSITNIPARAQQSADVPAAQTSASTTLDAAAAYERKDYATALRLYSGLAAQGDAQAQFELGSMYAQGRGVPKNDAEAAKWYQLSSDQGITEAQTYLASMYEMGWGVQQDLVRAAELYKIAAQNGDATAAYSLGNMYGLGEGVPIDNIQSERLYRFAAARGHAGAQSNLAAILSIREDPQYYFATGAFIITIFSLLLSYATVHYSNKHNKLGNLIAIQNFLHENDLSEARRQIREDLDKTKIPFSAVRRVFSSFDFAGHLVRRGAVDKSMFLDYWKIPLENLAKNVEKMGSEVTGSVEIREYYKDFWWLMEQAKNFRRP